MGLYGGYLLIALLALAGIFFGFSVSRDSGEKMAVTVGYSLFGGAVIITSVYKQTAMMFYPAQADVFVAMDEFIFMVAAALLVAWIIGMFVWGWVKGRQARERELYQKAHPNVEFKEGESVGDSLRKYAES